MHQDAVGGADDEVDRGRRDGAVAQTGPVEFAEEEFLHRVGTEPLGDRRVGDAALDVLFDAEVEVGEQAGAADEDEVVVLGEVFEEEPQPAEVGQVHQVRVVEDRGQRLPDMVKGEGLFDEFAFALEGATFELDADGFAEDFDVVGVGVQRPRDSGDQVPVLGQALKRLLDDALAGAGDAQHEAESPLLAMDLERVEDLLLVRQEVEIAEVEGVLGQS